MPEKYSHVEISIIMRANGNTFKRLFDQLKTQKNQFALQEIGILCVTVVVPLLPKKKKLELFYVALKKSRIFAVSKCPQNGTMFLEKLVNGF